jgi:transposase
VIVYAAIDIHKHAFQAAVLDLESGEVAEERFSADRESLARWAEQWRGRVAPVAIEATTGWRWVWRELVSHGFEVRLAEPVQVRRLLGRRRSAKTDRLDARWLARLLAKEMLPEAWIPPRRSSGCATAPDCARRWPRIAAAGDVPRRTTVGLLIDADATTELRACQR